MSIYCKKRQMWILIWASGEIWRPGNGSKNAPYLFTTKRRALTGTSRATAIPVLVTIEPVKRKRK